MKRLLAAICAGLAVSILVPSALARAAPASTGTVKSIVFASQDNHLWLVKGDGTGLHQIATTAGAEQSSPSFNSTGTQIAYEQGGEIWVLSTAGGSPRQLTRTGGTSGQAAWSPDGQWIAFAEKVGAGSDVFRIKPTGGSAIRVSFGAQHGCGAGQPAWSPDSASIAYARFDDGSGTCTGLGIVTQRLGHTGVLVVPGTVIEPSFTPSDNLVYLQLCPESCPDQWVGYEAAANGTQGHEVDLEDGCMAGDLCLESMVGAPAGGRGWISNDSAYDDNDPISDATTCFYGAYQKNGVVTQAMPHFCLNGILAGGFDVA